MKKKKKKSAKQLKKQQHIYNRTSTAQTPMARLPWLIRTHFCPYEILPIAQDSRKQIFRDIF